MSDRIFVAAVTAACRRRDITVTTGSGGWLIEMVRGPVRRLAFGYDIGLNGSVAHRVASDKAATSDLLGRAGIPAVPHVLFMDPELGGKPRATLEAALASLLSEHSGGLVLKPNDGNSGRLVIPVTTRDGAARAANDILARHLALVASPFLEITDEIRVVVLDGRVTLAYRKVRPSVTGDGVRSLRQLLASDATYRRDAVIEKLVREIGEAGLDAVPPAGQSLPLTFLHNLDAGARPALLPEGDLREASAALAVAAARAVDIRFASVDIVLTAKGMKVLEINSGVMMETLGRHHPDLVHAVYDEAVGALFGPREAL